MKFGVGIKRARTEIRRKEWGKISRQETQYEQKYKMKVLMHIVYVENDEDISLAGSEGLYKQMIIK